MAALHSYTGPIWELPNKATCSRLVSGLAKRASLNAVQEVHAPTSRYYICTTYILQFLQLYVPSLKLSRPLWNDGREARGAVIP